jgi:predicted amidophosphoribosyltransferase
MPGWPLCDPCVVSLRRAPPSMCRGTRVEAGFRHIGAAVRLVHNLKYRRSVHAGRVLAAAMVSGLPADASALVPVPRSMARRVTYGIDQAAVLAQELSHLTGVAVLDALGAPLWWKRQAGASRNDRHAIDFKRRMIVPEGSILIDDVFTTGTTAVSAMAAAGGTKMSILVATSAGSMEPGTKPFPSLGGDVTQMRETSNYLSHAAQSRLLAGSLESGPAAQARPDRSDDRKETG